ncbi:MAG: PTS fructose transporter subunit IIA [Nevskiaceae bacterium]|nr:MAG: PTS fructose transporter subunit IIA [Nevskiaceae bacterium]TBR73337.1 MAG: PTS fructose transporter subunit IIA [Nevskiaceae bacterium]
MTVGVLLVTHGKLGRLLLGTVEDLIGELPLPADVLEVRRVQSTDILLSQGRRMLERLDDGGGVLILTDAFGSTPSNIATALTAGGQAQVVAGVNLPMLVRIFNYPNCDLAEITQTAIDGGRRGILAGAPATTPSH